MFKGRGWTEKSYVINLIIAILLVQEMLILSCIFPTSDIASIATVTIPAIFAEVGVYSGFIVWKNKCENIQKNGGTVNGSSDLLSSDVDCSIDNMLSGQGCDI